MKNSKRICALSGTERRVDLCERERGSMGRLDICGSVCYHAGVLFPGDDFKRALPHVRRLPLCR